MAFRYLYCLGDLYLRQEHGRRRMLAVGLYFALGIPFMAYAKHMQKKKPEEWKQIILSPDNMKEEEE